MKHENKTGGAGLLRYGNFIAGEWQDAVGGEHITLRNPSDGSNLALIARGTKADIDLAVAAARSALSFRRLGQADGDRARSCAAPHVGRSAEEH